MTVPAMAHGQHAHRSVPGWLLLVVAVGVIAGLVLLLVPNGGSLAVAVLLGGLMLAHHLPGIGHGKRHGPAGSQGQTAEGEQDGEGGCH